MMKKISNRELEERVNRAVDNFMQGYGCCQSVLAAFCDLYGMDETLALKVDVTRHFFLNIGYCLYNYNYTNNLMLGIGYRFGS